MVTALGLPVRAPSLGSTDSFVGTGPRKCPPDRVSAKLAVARPDSALRLYLIFTIANGMMPSAPDREPIKPVLLYIALAAALALIAGLPLSRVADALAALAGPLTWVNGALVVTVLFDIVVFAALTLAYWLADMWFGG